MGLRRVLTAIGLAVASALAACTWSRVTVDPSGPELFMFSPGIVAANVAAHVPPR